MMSAILAMLPDRCTRFVFPSEIAASSALVAALWASEERALPARRFIGWDAFKAEVFAGTEAGRPATKAMRAIFARLLADENAAAPFLKSIVPEAVSATSARFAPSIASALPALRSVPTGPGDHLADWREIRRRYAAFLAERALYEAAWLGRTATPGTAPWCLFHPDLTEDWDDYAAAVESMPFTTIIRADTIDPNPVDAARFGTIIEEVRAVLLSIRQAHQNGTDASSMMISVASPEAVLPVLEREATMAGVPLDIREGRPLLESAGGRLVTDVVALSRSRMSFEALRRLLLDSSRPWKDPGTARRLLDIGIQKHVVAPLPDGPDIWEASIGGDDEARRLYRGLRTSAARIVGAPGFRSMRSAIDAFKRAFLDESAWSDRQNDEIARCMATIQELSNAAEALGIDPDSVPGAIDLYTRQLGDTRYLPVSESGGIPVYRFPVAAGARPALHYVINLAQGAAEAAARPLSFMRADERQLAGASDRDISSGLIRLLSSSGDRVVLSYSEDGPEGIRPPHAAIRARKPAELGMQFDRELWLPNRESDARAMTEVFPAQAASATAALRTVFAEAADDWSRGTPSDPARMSADCAEAVRLASSKDGVLRLSATAMGDYASCAFRRVMARHLRIEVVPSGLSFIDALLIGEIYHDAFRRLLRPLAADHVSIVAVADDTGGSGEVPRPGEDAARKAIAASMEAIAHTHGPMAAVLVSTASPSLSRHFTKAVASLARALDGWIPILVDDTELSAAMPEQGIELFGRPDLVCVAADDDTRASIVDYKKSTVPRKADLEPDSQGDIGALQIPVYQRLARAAGLDPESAWYLSIETAQASGKGMHLVFGPGDKPYLSVDQLPLLADALRRAVTETALVIASGHIYLPAIRDRRVVCEKCDLRPVCRAHYAVR
jgi:hypothetical protein